MMGAVLQRLPLYSSATGAGQPLMLAAARTRLAPSLSAAAVQARNNAGAGGRYTVATAYRS